MNADFKENGNVVVTMTKNEFFERFSSSEQPNTANIKTDCNQQVSDNNENDLLRSVTDEMAAFGIPRHIKGFNYIRRAIILSLSDKTYVEMMTKRLYPEVAREYETTPSRVERAIRHAIEVTWVNGNHEHIKAVFGNSIKADKFKPTNGEFLAMVIDVLSLRRKD